MGEIQVDCKKHKLGLGWCSECVRIIIAQAKLEVLEDKRIEEIRQYLIMVGHNELVNKLEELRSEVKRKWKE